MQYAVVIMDGASGDAVEELGGRTSLEAARTPNLDALAREGMTGRVQNVPESLPSCSNVACSAIMGYDPEAYPIGRGAIEGAALGIDLAPGQVALRLNLCTVEDGRMASYSSGNISTADAHAIMAELAVLDDDSFTLHSGTGFRGILVATGLEALMGCRFTEPHEITDEPVAGRDVPQAPDRPEAGFSPEQMREARDRLAGYCERARELIMKSPTAKRMRAEGKTAPTCVWAFWPGVRPGGMRPFADCFGLRARMNSAVDLLDGLAHLTGVEVVKDPRITDAFDNDYALQGALAIEGLEAGFDLVFCHVEAPDTAGHDGEPHEKVRAIERIDADIIAPLRAYAASHDLRIWALPDHPTSLLTKRHGREPVPFALWGAGVEPNAGERLTEAETLRSGFLLDQGHRFLPDHLLA